jgi:DNA-binding IclR family transcriptional regulator
VQPKRHARIQVIARAASILRILKHHPKGLSFGEIAQRVSLPRSTVQRIIESLGEEGLVIAASPTSGFRLGPALIDLAQAVQLDIAEFARPVLEQIAKDTGETVDLAVLDHDHMLCVDQIIGTHYLGVSGAGLKFSLHGSATGKAVLAAMDDQQIKKLRKRLLLTQMTQNTIISWSQLDAEIDGIRRTGVAFDHEETLDGICGVGVAFKGPADELAAISIPVPSQRFVSTKDDLVRTILRHCAKLQSDGCGTQKPRAAAK